MKRRSFLAGSLVSLAAAIGARAGIVVVQRKPHVSSNPSALVSGAGTAAANGTYTYRGLDSTTGVPLPYYNLVGQPSDPTTSSIACQGDPPPDNQWTITASDANTLYSTLDTGLEFPWMGTWQTSAGTNPAPTVSQS